MLSPSSKICVLGEETWQAAGTSSSIVIIWDLRFMLHHVKGRTQDIFRTECKLPIGRRSQGVETVIPGQTDANKSELSSKLVEWEDQAVAEVGVETKMVEVGSRWTVSTATG